jgi:hypothetical protein
VPGALVMAMSCRCAFRARTATVDIVCMVRGCLLAPHVQLKALHLSTKRLCGLSPVPRVCLCFEGVGVLGQVTNDVSKYAREALATVFDLVVEVEYVEFTCVPFATSKQQSMYGNWIERSFTKWRCLQFRQYDKVRVVVGERCGDGISAKPYRG